jgi:DNA-binding IclR family transcriptional regulator
MKPTDAIGRTGLFPATRSSIGMVLLSRLPVAEVRSLYRGQTLANFDSINDLLAELAGVRKQGFAVVRPYADRPTQTLAVAIENEPAAVAMSGQIAPDRVSELAAALKLVAEQISSHTQRRSDHAFNHVD